MGDVINYDRPIIDLIDRLSATGHVTHKAFRKTSVTFHHNAATVGHYHVLNVWKTRPASAHFNVDQKATVAQYVKVNEYAWACGNTEGNMRSIHIEMTNSGGHPNWPVSNDTWKSAARLAAWLHWKVLGVRPTRDTIRFHSDWKATACPGREMHGRRDELLKFVIQCYEEFLGGGKSTSVEAKAETVLKTSEADRWQLLLGVSVDGKWGVTTDLHALTMRNASLSNLGWPKNLDRKYNPELAQDILGVKTDGIFGPVSTGALRTWVEKTQRVLRVTDDGWWGPKTDAAFLSVRRRYLNNF